MNLRRRALRGLLAVFACSAALSACQGRVETNYVPPGGDAAQLDASADGGTPTCGNGTLDPGESCDGDCPQTCVAADACARPITTGAPATCDVQCGEEPITTCIGGDGCCAPGCSDADDSDCPPACGNGQLDPGERCDGNCPTDCDDGDQCTSDELLGASEACTAECVATPIQSCVDADGCCPPGCHALNDNDCAPQCGNDIVESGEICDGNCPSSCSDGDRCTSDTTRGGPDTCNVSCENTPITACVDADGCCPAACDGSNDSDCNSVCGNGVLEPGETCDPEGSCPTACTPTAACEISTLVGAASTCTAECVTGVIVACTDGDGCCPNGCNATNDDDCMPACGNSVVEPPELCDPVTSCPEVPADCDDRDACTADAVDGNPQTCSSACTHVAITACVDNDGCCPNGCNSANDADCSYVCGNGIVEGAELCDGNCPADATDCDDQVACTADSLVGSAAMCNAECRNLPITACTDGDGCCPSGCDETNDDDCSASCGNGTVESGETCDGNCPSSAAECDDSDACTTDGLTGDASTCTALCTNTDITSCTNADGCCPSACNATTDDDCAAMCGNGVTEAGETCDPPGSCPQSVADCDDMVACTADGFTGSAAACTAECTHVDITACVDADGCCPATCDESNDDDCAAVCGNGVVETGETCDPPASCPQDVGVCDDMDACTTDGLQGTAVACTAECTHTDITACVDADGCCPSGCTPANDDDCSLCGNGTLDSGETCDGDCPMSTADCTDNWTCIDPSSISGDASTCDAECQYSYITSCINGDTCCPPSCTYAMDDDCHATIDCKNPATWPSGWATFESEVLTLVNQHRANGYTCKEYVSGVLTDVVYGAGATAYNMDSALQEAARCHSLQMMVNGLNPINPHYGWDGSLPGARMTAAGYNWSYWAENIAFGQSSPTSAVNAWLSSTAGHCSNLMNPNLVDAGVGYTGDSGHLWTMTFARP